MNASKDINGVENLAKPATILVTRPLKPKDPTQHTFEWAQEAIEIAENLGYQVVDIKGPNVNYKYVTESIKRNKPNLYLHMGHGCPTTLQGISECIITRRFGIDELISMAENPCKYQELDHILQPLKSCCPQISYLENDPCSPNCVYDTNINLLKGSIIYAVACHSAYKLGKCASAHGVKSYIGLDDLLMFPVDSLNSQDIFKDVFLSFYRNLLLGYSVDEANREMSMLEDYLIKKNKTTKYIALPLLWNRLHRKIYGNKDAVIYE